uniref:Uncharacterized protein n=1 Tax=Picea glauca TaxID=3330 RepID=A0A101LTS5_PICGL|nr:hypothetical protein ABT39_MTgene3530 [Picea glauca]KUM45213.1 hypothetical protein ABT39_MTgene3536 [Picea glauca]KUM45913.1 hypothetical protein ABT39_MTgene2267 [Picea glauca]
MVRPFKPDSWWVILRMEEMEVGLEGVRNAVFVRFQIMNHGS